MIEFLINMTIKLVNSHFIFMCQSCFIWDMIMHLGWVSLARIFPATSLNTREFPNQKNGWSQILFLRVGTELWSSLKTHFPQMVKIDSLCCCLNIYVNIRTKNLVKNTFYSDESWNFRPKIWKKKFYYLVILHVFLYIDMFR